MINHRNFGAWVVDHLLSTHSSTSEIVSVRQKDCKHLHYCIGYRFIDLCGLERHNNLQAMQSSVWRTSRVVAGSVTLSLSKFLCCIYRNSIQSRPLGPVPIPGRAGQNNKANFSRKGESSHTSHLSPSTSSRSLLPLLVEQSRP